MALQPNHTAAWRRALNYFGLAWTDGRLGLTGLRRSRFGRHVEPQLDDEINDLKRRIDALEARRSGPSDGE